MGEHDAARQAHYERDKERDRLAAGLGRLEFVRTIDVISCTVPSVPATIADIGGAPGRYTDWLVERGYDVVQRDIGADHVAQVRERAWARARFCRWRRPQSRSP